MGPYKILLADDHAMVREGIKRILESDPGLELIGEVGDGRELLDFLKTSLPDLIILDISMPDVTGLEALKKIKADHPQVKVLILTVHKSAETLLLAFSAQVDGYLLKDDVSEDLFNAIQNIRQGKYYISNLLSGQTATLFREITGKSLLTSRERTVLQFMVQGKTTKQIAVLSIATATVYVHRTKLKKKLKINTDAGLLAYALQKGYGSAK